MNIQKRDYIILLAKFLHTNGKIMSGPELADHLNRNKFRTEYDSEYNGERGIYTLLSAVYDQINPIDPVAGECIALAFVTKDDNHAWKDK